MKRYDVIVVGAGPAGLSAAIETARRGLKTIVFDENARPGGQLIKQIHKFFGSKEHMAKERGFHIGEDLLKEAEAAGVEVCLNSIVAGLYLDKEVVVKQATPCTTIKVTPSSSPPAPPRTWSCLMDGLFPASSAPAQPRR